MKSKYAEILMDITIGFVILSQILINVNIYLYFISYILACVFANITYYRLGYKRSFTLNSIILALAIINAIKIIFFSGHL